MTSREQRQYNWTFCGFKTPVGNMPVRDWINALSADGREELIDILIYMRFRPPNEWAPEHFKALDDRISELRFRDSGSICRMYGYFGPQWLVRSEEHTSELQS